MLFARKIITALAIIGFLAGACQVNLAVAGNPVAQNQQVQIRNVSLDSNGALAGRIVNGDQKSVSGTEVIISQGNKEIARTSTNEQGQFSVENLSNGVYMISSSSSSAYYRVWDVNSAPPASDNYAVLTSGNYVARGRTYTNIVTIVGVGALGTATYFVIDANDNDDKVTNP